MTAPPPDYVIAGLRYRLADVCPLTRDDFEARLPEFAADGSASLPAGDPDVFLFAERTETPPNPAMFSQEVAITREGTRDGTRDGSGGGVTIGTHRFDFEGTWNSARREARCRYAGGIASLNSFLRIVSSFALLERGGLLLHASSVASNGRGFVFAGVSGAGKTTLARLGSPRPVLSDEVAALRPTPAGFMSYPTPFWGDMVRVRAGSAVPLVALGFPIQKHAAKLTPATSSEALSRLLECAIAFDLTPVEKAGLVDVAAAILRAVPCLCVEFGLDAPPWSLLDAYPPSPPAP